MAMFAKRGTALAASTLVFSLGCDQARFGAGDQHPTVVADDARALFAEDFESGTLSAWSDGVDLTRLRVITDPSLAQSGRRFLSVTYPAGSDGGWLTRFLMPGQESLYVSYYLRFPQTWVGGTKLVAFNGSRTDNQWSAFGRAGLCPTGADFFSTMLVVEPTRKIRFYSYYPEMAREPDHITCWGRHGDGSETYRPPLALVPDVWHRIEFQVVLNTPQETNAHQSFWVDGVERGTWSGFSFRNSRILRLNSVQLSFSVSGGVPQTQELYVDNLVVLRERPALAARR